MFIISQFLYQRNNYAPVWIENYCMNSWFLLGFPFISCKALVCKIRKHCKIAKGCPEYISSVVKVSSCYYQKTVLSFVRNWVIRIWVLWQFKFEFCHNFSFGFIIIWFVEFFCCLSFWFLLLFELLQFEFLGFVTIWVFEFCCYLIL